MISDDAIKKNMQKREEGEKKIKKQEERVAGFNQNVMNIRQVNAVAVEVREMEKREKRIVMFNVPESTEGEEAEKSAADGRKIKEILKELDFEGTRPVKAGKFPQQILVTLHSAEEAEKMVKRCQRGPALADSVFIT